MSLSDLTAQIRALCDQIDAHQCEAEEPPPTGAGSITFPQANYVFHRDPNGSKSVQPTKTGDGTFRVKQGTTVVAEGAGPFTLPMGWYLLELVDGETVLDSRKFGVGYHYIAWGQSNAMAYREAGDLAITVPMEGRCIIGELNTDGTAITYRDCFHESVDLGLTWQFMMLELRQLSGRDVPYCVTPCGLGATQVQTLAVPPLLTKFTNAMALCSPGMVFSTQGEANDERNASDISVLAGHYTSIINAANAVKTVPWLMNLVDHAHVVPASWFTPASSHWPVALAQESVVTAMANVYWGIDLSVMGKPYPLTQSAGRTHAEVHFVGSRKTTVAALMKQRINDVAGLNV